MHTPKGARRVGGCDSDRRSDDDNTVGGWMVVYGVAKRECLDLLAEREREREPVGQAGSRFPCVVYPNNTPHGAVDTHV